MQLNSDSLGKVIVEDIYSKSGALLMKAGVELTKSIIERLQKNNITEVSVAE
jgi:hypothetical protein